MFPSEIVLVSIGCDQKKKKSKMNTLVQSMAYSKSLHMYHWNNLLLLCKILDN